MKKFLFLSFIVLTFFSCQTIDEPKTENPPNLKNNASSNETELKESTREPEPVSEQEETVQVAEANSLNDVNPQEKTSQKSEVSEIIKDAGGVTETGEGFGEMSLERYNNMTGEAEVVTEKVSETVSNYDFHDYVALDVFLHRYVSSAGKVNYAGIKSNKNTLNDILSEFESNYPESSWSSKQKLTYWINAYNIYTIKLIVDNYPTTSITKITAKPWEKKFIKLGGKTYDLNTIENGIIRKQFNEPRIHFALNCASKSCPVLLNAAYTPEKLYSQLTSQTKRFMKDATKNDFSNPKKIKISQLFDWYKEDFTKNGTVIDFINKYRTEQLDNPKIEYMEYSWDLNN